MILEQILQKNQYQEYLFTKLNEEKFIHFIHLVFNDLNYLLEEALDKLQQIKTFQMLLAN